MVATVTFRVMMTSKPCRVRRVGASEGYFDDLEMRGRTAINRTLVNNGLCLGLLRSRQASASAAGMRGGMDLARSAGICAGQPLPRARSPIRHAQGAWSAHEGRQQPLWEAHCIFWYRVH